MEFRLLGPVEASRDDRPVALGGTKPQALLALLLLHANELVSRDRIIDALWSDRAPGSAEHSLDVQVSRLRKVLAPDEILLTRSGGYVLEVDPEQIDSRRFERLLEEGRRANAAGRPEGALAVLTKPSRSGGARRWAIWRTRTSPAPRATGSRSFGSVRPRSESTRSLRSADPTPLSRSWRRLRPRTPFASGCADSRCSLSTARVGRRKHSVRTATSAGASARSSESSPGMG